MHPWRKDYTQHRASGHIWVLVEGNTDALLLSLFQKLDNLINLIPVLFTAYLEMGVVNPYARLTADFNNFFIESRMVSASLLWWMTKSPSYSATTLHISMISLDSEYAQGI